MVCVCTLPLFDAIGRDQIEVVDQYKYLGVVVNNTLNTDTTTEHLAMSGSRALAQVIHKTKHNFDLGYETYTKLFHSMVTPILDYCNGVWNIGKNCKRFDNVQNRAIRYYCRLNKTSPIAGMNGDMGWTPGLVRRDIECIRFYNQLIRMNSERLTHRVMEYDFEQCENSQAVSLS